MYRITKTNPRVFAEEKFDDGYRGFNAAPKETREETESRFKRLVKKCKHVFRVCDDDGIRWGQRACGMWLHSGNDR